MAAMWGLIGNSDSLKCDELGERLRHRGTHEITWSPAPSVLFAWRQDYGRAPPTGATRVPLMFTGCISNRYELSQRLGRKSFSVPAHSDAEMLWALYCLEGTEAFALVKGQFAVALYDRATKEVILASDRWAAQPLYVARIDDYWAFASEYRALLALSPLDARIDPESLAFLNGSKYLPARKALLSNVQPVAPGEVLRLTRDRCEAQAYSPLTLRVSQDSSEQVLARNLRDELLIATHRVVAGRQQVGIALSAGLDSTLTLGLVRAVAPNARIHTYTASFDPQDPDLALAGAAARYFGTVHREVILSPEDLPRLMGELVWAMEDPCAREEMLVYHVLAQQAAQDVPVLIYGHMADVLFGGMPRHLLIRLAASVPMAQSPLAAFYNYTQTGEVPRSLLARLLVFAYYRRRPVQALRVLNADSLPDDPGLELGQPEPLNVALLAALRNPTEVAAMERLHARAGVKFASVFHDGGVAQLAFCVPDRLKIRGACRKYILRQAARGILPGSFLNRPKGMLRVSQDRRLHEVVDDMAAELLTPALVRERGLFDPEQVASLLRNWRGKEDFSRVWTLLLIELWCRTFIDGRGASCPASLMAAERMSAHARSRGMPTTAAS